MAKRNPDSVHQAFMKDFFGKEAANYPADWSKWPEPQKSIYSRMMNNKHTIVSWAFINNIKKAITELNKLHDVLITID